MSVAGHLFLLLACLAGGAFFAGMETGIVSINRLRLRHLVIRRVRGAGRLERFVREPDRLLGTTLIGTNLCYVIASVEAARLGEEAAGLRGAALAGAALTAVILVACEYLPKAWFQSAPARRTLPLAPVLSAFAWIFWPFRWLLSSVVGGVLGALPVRAAPRPLLTRDDLLHLTTESASSGVLTADEVRMIRGVFELSGRTCGDIMVPRDRMVTVNHDLPAPQLVELARARRLHRFPVWNAEKKAFVGIVHVFDVVRDSRHAERTVEAYLRPPQLISARLLVDHVLPRMRVTRQPMVLVNDDRFEVVGLITLDDVLNEIVGEL